MPMAELESSVEMLGPIERGYVLSVLADQCVSKDARFLPNYWKRDEYFDWLRLYGRTILRKHYAESEKAFTLIVPNDDESMTIWDYFHQPIPYNVKAPWFVTRREYNLNHRGLLLRRNWAEYSSVFRDIVKPGAAFQPLIPGNKPNTWIVDDIITETIPMECVPKPWKDPEL